MAQMTSGKVLREARERKGYDLSTVARRLRIRPDILRAIEAGDFNNMPPRGYTRNMVNAYARLLGLNPTEIVNMYLDEAYANQVEKARDVAPRARFDMGGKTSRGKRISPRGGRDRTLDPEDENISTARASALGRTLYDDRTRFSRDDYGVTRTAREREGRSSRDFLSHHSGYSNTGFTFMDEDMGRRPRQRSFQNNGFGMSFSRPSRLAGIFQSRLALVLALVLVIAVIVVIVTILTGSKNAPQSNDVATLPVSGITDTTKTGDEGADEPKIIEIAPTSARVVYRIKNGEDCYYQTIDGDDHTSEYMVYSDDKVREFTVDVDDEWTIATWAYDALEVYVDGELVTLKSDSEYGGMYTYTVDFSEILDKWMAEHPSGSSRRTSAVQ